MLEGLEIEEININNCINNKDFRIDSNFYTMLPSRNPNLDYRRIGDCLISSQYGMSITMNEEGIGIPIYRMNEIHDLMCDLDVNKFAVISSRELKIFKLQDRDVLFNRTNSYDWVGRTGLYFQNDDIQRVFASYLVRLIPDTSILLPEYLVTFLNSKYGMLDIKRRARQSINQTNVNPEEVKEIEIPILSKKIQQSIAEKFEIANKKRVLAKQLYEGAESRVLEALGLDDFTFNSNTTSVKTYKESFLSSGRFDAEYYQPKYEDYYNLVCQYENGYKTIGEICQIKDKNIIPKEKEEYNYIELADVGKTGIILDSSKMLGIDLPSRARRVVHTGDIVISSLEGSLDSCAYITEDYEGSMCSTGFYVVKSDEINPETLLILFKSLPIQQLIKRGCSGAIMSAISRAELDVIPLPLIVKDIQIEIANLVQKSFSLRKEAKKLLDEAKRIVEDSISSSINN